MARPSCTHTRSIRIRPIRPDDGCKLQRLHGRLSDSTIYQRFHGPKPELDEVRARGFAACQPQGSAEGSPLLRDIGFRGGGCIGSGVPRGAAR